MKMRAKTICAAMAAAAAGCLAAGAAEIRLAPKGETDMTAEFAAAVAKVRADGGGTISLEPGDYRFSSPVKSDIWVSNHDNPRPRRIFVPVCGVSNLTVRCTQGAARFVCDGEGIAFMLMDTKDVRIENIVFDYLRPFFSIWTLKGGKLTQCDRTYTYELDGRTIYATGTGWRERQVMCEMFDAKTKAYIGTTRWDGSIDMDFGMPDGTIAMTRSPYRPNPCVLLYRAESTVFTGCGAFASAGMGFIAQRSVDVRIDGWRTRGGRPLALQADATHFSNCKGDVIVENCVFEGMVDDAINVHSTSLRIVDRKGADTIICKYMHVQSVGFETFRSGETLRFIKGATFEPGMEMKVVSSTMTAHDTVELKLAGDVPGEYGVGDAVENADWQPNVCFRKNVVRNSSPRATLFTTPGRIVCTDNLFENVAGQPIYLAGDAWDWYESGACRDVLVKNNVFRRCGFKSGRGMIQIEPAVHDLKAQKERYHRNILVENNVFEDFTLPLVWARSAENVVLRGNKIINGNERIVTESASVRIEK